ncbi:hypothetical protein T265_06928 [Opisthorchis viverrini]|uniref:Uncharacterized protein n=1 Tax=Opisthorchis viverrini TaxID=6198 RepID=A0A074ZIL3_OPIVI|nr:hypothetical protein T265_06928 [Opisthorchis viverrini]KER25637.1 hypothetical protein T265_06928 [Opisthorchis viverrini]
MSCESLLGQPGCILALVLPSGGMATRHRKGATTERFLFLQDMQLLSVWLHACLILPLTQSA